jgi:hypothetical protein
LRIIRSVKPLAYWRIMRFAAAAICLVATPLLAGVLLGKTRFNSLYGELDEPSQGTRSWARLIRVA